MLAVLSQHIPPVSNYQTNAGGGSYMSHLPAAFLHHDPAMLIQPSGFMSSHGYFVDFDVPSLDEIK